MIQDSQYKILELFPIPVFTSHLPDNLSNILPWLYNQEMIGDKNDRVEEYGKKSTNTYLLEENECKDLKLYLLDLVKTYGDLLGYNYGSYKFTQSWISRKDPNEGHRIHSHPNSLISGLFYFGNFDNLTPAIHFHKDLCRGHLPTLEPKKINNLEDLKYGKEYYPIDFIPGLILLFPSSLYHSVPINNSQTSRYSLAFNVVPTEGFGDMLSLTELKL